MKKTLLITAILLVSAPGYCPADTIELHNGRIIHGKVAGELPAAGPVRISFTGGGSLPCLLYTSPSPRDATRDRMAAYA